MVVPCGSSLVRIRRVDEGFQSTSISSVRFSELVVPSDAEVIAATLALQNAQAAAVTVPPSQIQEDMLQSLDPEQRLTATGTPDFSFLSRETAECTISCGDENIPAHKAVLSSRSNLFKALFASGMRDADSTQFTAPDHITPLAVRACVEFMYTDASPSLTATTATEILHAATFYQLERLRALCESRIAQDVAEHNAVNYLELAEETGCSQLKRAVISFIVANFQAVAESDAFPHLDPNLLVEVTAESCRQLQHVSLLLDQVAKQSQVQSDSD